MITNENKELLQELNDAFEEAKKELGLKYTLEEFDRIFFIKDAVLASRFTGAFSRNLSRRIVDTYNSWLGYANGILMPPPGNIMLYTESQAFNDDEKEELMKIITAITEFTSRNTLIGITKDKKAEGEFLNESVRFWNEDMKPKFEWICKKTNSKWKEMVEDSKKPSKNRNSSQ